MCFVAELPRNRMSDYAVDKQSAPRTGSHWAEVETQRGIRHQAPSMLGFP